MHCQRCVDASRASFLGAEHPNPHSAGHAEAVIDNGTASNHHGRELLVLPQSAGATAIATAIPASPATAAPTGLVGCGGNATGAGAATGFSAPLAPGKDEFPGSAVLGHSRRW